jgi:restriction endonuclease S subunit
MSEVLLGELLNSKGITYGVVKPGDYETNGIPLIKAADVENGRVNTTPNFRISREKHQEHSRTELNGGELLITLVGTPGQCAIAPPEVKGFNVVRAVGVFSVNTLADSRFIMYSIQAPESQAYIRNVCNTTVQANLNLGDFKGFPDSFEDSELGAIPSGWEVAELGDCELDVESGRRPKGGIDKNLASGIPSIGAESIAPVGQFDFSKTKWVDNDFADSSSKGWIQNFDVALYKDGGKPGEFRPRTALYGDGFPFDKAMVNEHVFLLRSILLGQPYLYYLFNFDLVLAQSFTRVRRKERNQVSIKKKCDRVPSSNQTRD